jgi:hypothetical protein
MMLKSQSHVRIKEISTLNDGEYTRIEDERVRTWIKERK